MCHPGIHRLMVLGSIGNEYQESLEIQEVRILYLYVTHMLRNLRNVRNWRCIKTCIKQYCVIEVSTLMVSIRRPTFAKIKCLFQFYNQVSGLLRQATPKKHHIYHHRTRMAIRETSKKLQNLMYVTRMYGLRAADPNIFADEGNPCIAVET